MTTVLAHGLGGSNDLPIPYTYALIGAAWALTLTFAVVALAWRTPRFDPAIQRLLDDRGPDLKVIGEAFEPKLNDIAGALMNFDTGQLLSNMLDAVPPDGTITLRVVP